MIKYMLVLGAVLGMMISGCDDMRPMSTDAGQLIYHSPVNLPGFPVVYNDGGVVEFE